MAYLDPYTGPWTQDEAAHLGRRAGFGAHPDELAVLTGLGAGPAVDRLVDYSPADAAFDALIASLPDSPTSDLGRIKDPTTDSHLQGWWIYRMVHTTRPLQEQFTLFLHDTLVSEISKVASGVFNDVNYGNDGSTTGQRCTTGTLPPDAGRKGRIIVRLLRDQNNLYRTQGHAGYHALLRAVTRDPAMLIYLDNYLNIKGKAQENYAREIMELFSMGVGNYSEADVREVARAFTGESIAADCSLDWPYTYRFDPARHETGTKTVFGSAVNNPAPGEETNMVIDLILDRISGASISPAHSVLPAACVYMAWKLITWFVHESIPIDHEAVAELADRLHTPQSNGYRFDMREALRVLFNSTFFFDPAWRYAMHKHPADYAVMAMRTLGLEETSYTGQAKTYFASMGMKLFNPPNVAGWNHGTAWINSGNLINRFNYANRLSGSSILTSVYLDALIPSAIASFADHAGMIEYFRARLLQTALRPEEEAIMTQFLSDIEATTGSASSKYYRKMRGLMHLVMSLPRYQLK